MSYTPLSEIEKASMQQELEMLRSKIDELLLKFRIKENQVENTLLTREEQLEEVFRRG